MTHNFELLKNGNVKITVWANPITKEIVPAHRNCFGWNCLHDGRTEFFQKYHLKLRINQGKAYYSQLSYSAKNMNELGFQLVMRGTAPLWK